LPIAVTALTLPLPRCGVPAVPVRAVVLTFFFIHVTGHVIGRVIGILLKQGDINVTAGHGLQPPAVRRALVLDLIDLLLPGQLHLQRCPLPLQGGAINPKEE